MKAEPKTLSLVPVNKKLTAEELKLAPTLSTGDDKAVAKELNKRFSEAQNGLRRVVALGLFIIEIKELKLKHGQFGSWLAAYAPKLCRLDSVTGKAKATHALSSYLEITTGVLEALDLNEKKYCDLISNSPQGGIWKGGKLLLLTEAKVPEEVRPLRQKICDLVDGKTQKQVLMDFKQVEDDADGTKVKRGRLKGQGGKRKLTIEEEAAARKQLATEDWSELDERLEAYRDCFVLLDDGSVNAQIARLEQALAARHAWLKQPKTKRDAAAIEKMLCN